jgi:hypothetical protein
MAYDRPSFYLTFGGTQLGTAEIWQTGIHYAPLDESTTVAQCVTALAAISVADIYSDLTNIFNTAVTSKRYANNVHLRFAKVAVLDESGHYAAAPKIHEGDTAGTVASANGVPPQLAVVFSLWSGTKFGQAQRGRMYFPVPIDFMTAVSSTTGQVPQSNVDQWSDTVAVALNNAGGEVSTVTVPTFPAIMSKLGSGTTKLIAQFGAGRIIDTQRSRRNQLVEAITYKSWPT